MVPASAARIRPAGVGFAQVEDVPPQDLWCLHRVGAAAPLVRAFAEYLEEREWAAGRVLTGLRTMRKLAAWPAYS
jgi:hypothetical protein